MHTTPRRDARAKASIGSKALSSCIALATLASLLLVPPARSEGSDGAPLEQRTRRPNVLIFLTDDQRIGTLKHMPATRRLIGRKGVTYENAFATTPLCCPSRASIMTGRYAHNHTVRDNSSAIRLDMSTTLQHNLHEAGYHTAIVGKFMNGWSSRALPPDFDRSVVLISSQERYGSNGYTQAVFNVNGRLKRVHRYSTDFMGSRAGSILRRFDESDRRPWMMFVSPNAPHFPAIPPRRHSDAHVGEPEDNPAMHNANPRDKAPEVRNFVLPRRLPKFARRQKRTLLAVDEMVAAIFRTMRNLGEVRRTLVIFLSDNGMMWGEHGLSGKEWPYTHSLKIPLLLRWPQHILPNTRSSRMVANIDVAPTVYQATATGPDHVMDGRSLLSQARRRSLLLENWDNRQWKSVRTRSHQYIEYYGRRGIQFRELYHLRRDPWQLRNLLHRHPRRHRDIATRLHQRLKRYRNCNGTLCP